MTDWCSDLNVWPVWVRCVPQWWCSEASELHECTPLCTTSRTLQTELSQKAKWLICEQKKHHMRNAQMPHLTACQYTGLHLQLVEKPTLWIFLSTVNINTVSQVLVNSELTPCFWRQWSCPLSLAKLFQSYCVHYSLDVYCVYFDAKTQKLVQLEEMHGSILLRIKPIARINLGDVKTLQNLETFRCLYLETSCFTSFGFPLYPSQLSAYGLVILKHKNYLVRLWKR